MADLTKEHIKQLATKLVNEANEGRYKPGSAEKRIKKHLNELNTDEEACVFLETLQQCVNDAISAVNANKFATLGHQDMDRLRAFTEITGTIERLLN